MPPWCRWPAPGPGWWCALARAALRVALLAGARVPSRGAASALVARRVLLECLMVWGPSFAFACLAPSSLVGRVSLVGPGPGVSTPCSPGRWGTVRLCFNTSPLAAGRRVPCCEALPALCLSPGWFAGCGWGRACCFACVWGGGCVGGAHVPLLSVLRLAPLGLPLPSPLWSGPPLTL